jgi:hypothetical protein
MLFCPPQNPTGSPTTNPDFDYIRERDDLQAQARDAVLLAQAKMKIWYDNRHRRSQFEDWVYLRLAKKGTDGYHLQNQNKISHNKIGPLKVLERKGLLAYRLQLPEWLTGVHPIISVEHLEPAPALESDPYHRPQPEPGPVQMQGMEKYLVEKILRKESRSTPGRKTRQVYYEVKWLRYEETSWVPRS